MVSSTVNPRLPDESRAIVTRPVEVIGVTSLIRVETSNATFGRARRPSSEVRSSSRPIRVLTGSGSPNRM